MLQLSNEILWRILRLLYLLDEDFDSYGNKEDLLACRVTCRRLANIGESLAFEHIILPQDEEGYKMLRQMPFHLCSEVRRLTFYFEDFEADPMLEVFAESRGYPVYELQNNHCIESIQDTLELNMAFENYCRRHQYQQEMKSGKKDLHILNAVLPRFSSLRSTRLLEDRRSHVEESLIYSRISIYSHAGQQFFNDICQSLASLEVKIEELVLGHFDRSSSSLLGIIGGLTPANSELYREVFGGLKRFQVVLPMSVDVGEDENEWRDGINSAGLSAIILSAPLLEELRLGYDIFSVHAIPSWFLESLHIPHLQTLRISEAGLQSPSPLVTLLTKHATTLRTIEFRQLSLKKGSWEPVFIAMREVLSLSSIEMYDFMTGGLVDDENESDEDAEDNQETAVGEIDDNFISDDNFTMGEDRELYGVRDKDLVHKEIRDFIQRKNNRNPYDSVRSTVTSFCECA